MTPRDRSTLFSRIATSAQRVQWQVLDLDWSVASSADQARTAIDSAFGMAAFESSPLRRYGQSFWSVFRSEFQSWMVSQFLPGEQAALLAATRLRDAMPESDARACVVSQVFDEARHVEVFSRYLKERAPSHYGASPSLSALLRDALADARWDVTVLGVHIIVEGLALSTFRLANRAFDDALIRRICLLAASDEARHVAVGVAFLRERYLTLTASERLEREELALEAVALVKRRFLLDEIWARLGVDRALGVAFATGNPMMVAYRHAVCSRLVKSLTELGLANDRVRRQLRLLGLTPQVRKEASQ